MKLIPLSDYIIHEFNNKAEQIDKVKVIILTIFNTIIATVVSVQGVVSFLKIEGSLWPNILVAGFAFGYFRTYRLWFVGHAMMGKFEENGKTEDDNE